MTNLGRITVGYSLYNKRHLVNSILNGIEKSFALCNEFIFLVDNCSDGTFDALKEGLRRKRIEARVMVPKEELFEIKANNEILKAAKNEVVVLFQDDIIADDYNFEQKILNIVDKYGDKLGLVGGRSGYEFTDYHGLPEECVRRVSNWEHKSSQYGETMDDGGCEERTFLNRGPLVFTKKLINDVGYLDESYFPLWADDLDYCAKAKFKHGKTNVVFQCGVKSDIKWGALHSKSTTTINMRKVINKNWNLFIERWGKDIDRYYYEDIVVSKR